MQTPELRPETLGIEQTKVLVDKETGIKTILREIGEETIDATIKSPEGHTLSYVNFEEISKFQDQERILEMMGFKPSIAISELIQNDEKSEKYYIKFLPPDKKQ